MGRLRLGGYLLLLLAVSVSISAAWAEVSENDLDTDRAWPEVPENDEALEGHKGRVLLQISNLSIRNVQRTFDQAKRMLEPVRKSRAYLVRCPSQLGWVFGWKRNAILLARTAYSRRNPVRARVLTRNAIAKATICLGILNRHKNPTRYRLRSAIGVLKRCLQLMENRPRPRPAPRPAQPPRYPQRSPPRKTPPPRYPQRSPPRKPPPRAPYPQRPPTPRPRPPTPTPVRPPPAGGPIGPGNGPSDYPHALKLSFLYYEAQRSGRLPPTNRVRWRSHSGLRDGADNGVDLTGGYYDAGDNVKFGLPMAYTVTMLAYGVVEFRAGYKSQLGHALEAIKWGTDYLLKAWKPSQKRLYGQVGNGQADHACWQRPEDYTEDRPSYYIDASRPGTDLACETAAALAAAAIVFRSTNAVYAQRCLTAAEQLFRFGTEHRGSYHQSMQPAAAFYPSYSGFNDEMLWSAAWLYRATRKATYSGFINSFNQYGDPVQVSWDDKFAAAATLIAGMSLERGSPFPSTVWVPRVENFVCKHLPGGSIRKTPGGVSVIQYWSNLAWVSTAMFVSAVHQKHMRLHRLPGLQKCGKSSADITAFTNKETQYILGRNPKGMSYMVGFGNNYPKKPHHRGASIPTPTGAYPSNDFSCNGGFKWLNAQTPNPHVLYGSLIGGPGGNGNDDFNDDRNNYAQSEPSLYNTAALTGLLAALQL